ncbi:T9SS type A sorting domain-containing protein [Carboxylicivirga sediminis]|uniref:T9SS type A sorting domain-containing protein n=1 Tax=Carboxylicivirga sediminis TaxID=2006564 RepID=A0A941IX89_9BACT|nr:T9SS type A sorting domain-containing protein [Carboxylicivirga sediminis]MBR8535815.1 T9SS type A sorting domain-containing protein [Carboxylicivirga sediminis]
MRINLCILSLLFLGVFTSYTKAQTVELKDNFFYIDGEKFFVKGVGYELGALPGQLPWQKTFSPEQIHNDIQRILAGGFNTIRTWAPFTKEELDVIAAYDIKIIMGIWIDPHGDFSDPVFINEAENIVRDVLSYSKDYGNIIAYLIMNEPSPATIFDSGYTETTDLWQQLVQIIHSGHPGRPVSISNTCNGTYIDSGIFDFKAFNVYVYNPVTVNYLYEYQDYIAYLRTLNQPEQPLIISEYGLSVSPSGPGNWGYGGNTLSEQTNGVLHMYQSLVNGGAAGSCVFNYADGWWKAGNEYVHDDAAEEWFGLVEYSSLSDAVGTERPAWNVIHDYQRAIITEPRNGEVYGTSIPVEVFVNDGIGRMQVYIDDLVMLDRIVDNNYLKEYLQLESTSGKDIELVFRFYDKAGIQLKEEERRVLFSNDEIGLPSISISINNSAYWEQGYVDVTYTINGSDAFQLGNKLSYCFYPHIGFEYGFSYSEDIAALQNLSHSVRHYFNSTVDVITLGAAMDISWGAFEKRIVNSKVLSRENTLVTSLPVSVASNDFTVYPNPAESYITIQPMHKGSVQIYAIDGTLIKSINYTGQRINVADLVQGMYIIRFNNSIGRFIKL